MTPVAPQSPLVGVVMGSKSDWETMRHASEVLAELGIPHESKRGFGPPNARAAVSLRPRSRGPGSRAFDRRGRRERRTCRACWRRSRSCRSWACRSRARSCAGLIRSCRSCRCPGASRSALSPSAASGAANAALLAARDSGAEVSRDPRGPGSLPPEPDRLRGRIAGMSLSTLLALQPETRRSSPRVPWA